MNTDKVFGTSVDYSKVFRNKFNYDPSYDYANASACGLAFQFAIEKAQSLDPEKVRDALASMDEMSMVGRIKFNTDRSRFEPPMYITQIQSKDPITDPFIVSPKTNKEADIIYPNPPWNKR